MDREQQQLEETVDALESEVEAKLHRRAEDREGFNDGSDENTVIVGKSNPIMAAPARTRKATITVVLSLVLLALLIVLIVLMLQSS